MPPITPITREMYTRQGVPWFELFDDYMDSITETSQALAAVRSVSQMDESRSIKGKESMINPDSPPFCPQHRRNRSECVFRPCGHAVCHQCLGSALMGGSKCWCGSSIAKFIGMKRPMAQVTAPSLEEGDEEADWNVEEIEQVSLDAVKGGKVIVIHLTEDRPAPLQQHRAEETIKFLERAV